MTDFRRVPPPPSNISGIVGDYLHALARAINDMPQFSAFSGVSPNQSIVTGYPGDLVVNLTSQNTNARLWIMAGGARVPSSSNWSVILP